MQTRPLHTLNSLCRFFFKSSTLYSFRMWAHKCTGTELSGLPDFQCEPQHGLLWISGLACLLHAVLTGSNNSPVIPVTAEIQAAHQCSTFSVPLNHPQALSLYWSCSTSQASFILSLLFTTYDSRVKSVDEMYQCNPYVS